MAEEKRELKIGLIGYGKRARLALHAHRPGAGSRVVACADTSEVGRNEFLQEFTDTRAYSDYRQMLERETLDAVFVTSPDFLHEEHAVAALKKGIGVYLEKPMAIEIESCDRIITAAAKSGAKLYVGHNMRHMPFVRKMKSLIDGGAIGEVKAAWCRHFIAYGGDAYYKDWHAERRYANSLLLQKAVHDIDVMHWLCHGQTQVVVAMGQLCVYNQVTDRRKENERPDVTWHETNWPPLQQHKLNPIIDVEDLNHVLMQLDNGVMMTYQQCHFAPDGWRNYTIIGTEGRIENIGDEPGKSEIRLWNRRTSFLEGGNERFPIPATEGSHGGADPLIINEFLGYLRGEIEPAIRPEEARGAVAAGVLAAQSLRTGCRPLRVPPLNHK